MSERYNDNMKRAKPPDTQLGIFKIYILLENSAEGRGSRRERCWYYVVSVFENTPQNLVVQGRAQLEHNSHIVEVGVEPTCLRVNP